MMIKPTEIRAAAYCRMSSAKQGEKSIDEQRAEITKLAAREGFRIVEWYEDKAITGDSTTDERSGLAALLRAAQAGDFRVVLAWHTNRISREDPMDAIVLYNQLRKAGISLHTCGEGAIDLEDFAKQLLLFVTQKGSNDFLSELAAKTLRGRIASVKAGGWGGGPAVYGMDRGLFAHNGKLVRRLQAGEYVKQAGHQVRLLPSTDKVKVEAVRFAFRRFDEADLTYRALALELTAKGYPAPGGTTWRHGNVINLLRTRAYVGTNRWGATASGKYHTTMGGDIATVNGKATNRHKPEEDVIAVADAWQGIIPVELFGRVQRKLRQRETHPTPSRRAKYPLAGLMVCGHCGQPMYGTTHQVKDRKNGRSYRYVQYICSTYGNHGLGGPYNSTCGHFWVDADRVLAWLVHALQEEYLEANRDAMVKEIKSELKRQKKTTSSDLERLRKRADDLDKQVGRLVKAVRTVDAAEVVEELAIVRAERDRIKAELEHAGKATGSTDVDVLAELFANQLHELGEHLNDADPAVLREALHQFISRITCRWDRQAGKTPRVRNRLIEGKVELQPQSVLHVVAGIP